MQVGIWYIIHVIYYIIFKYKSRLKMYFSEINCINYDTILIVILCLYYTYILYHWLYLASYRNQVQISVRLVCIIKLICNINLHHLYLIITSLILFYESAYLLYVLFYFLILLNVFIQTFLIFCINIKILIIDNNK